MLDKKFLIIGITLPYFYKGEAEKIIEIFQNEEADIIHLRKPYSNLEKLEKLIKGIPEEFYPRLRLHDHFSLMDKYGLGGVHLNSRNPEPPSPNCNTSKSIHTIQELNLAAEFDYVTLSPIFDSISKPGYLAQFNLEDLKKHLHDRKVIALGGVTPEKFMLLKQTGFKGAAMSGYFFK